MRIPGEGRLFVAVAHLYNCLGTRIFVRRVIENDLERNYGQMREWWNEEKHMVHRDMANPIYYFSCVDEVLDFQEKDNVVDIGCGDGTIDSFIHVSHLYGIDFAQTKLKEARRKNPAYTYHEQSFLDRIDPADGISYNKCFSYGVVQYCAPEDIDLLLKNSIDVVLKNVKSDRNSSRGEKIVAHLEIPDIGKAYSYYNRYFGITEEVFSQYKTKIRTIFSDGSYWHNMKELKEKCLKYIAEEYAGVKAVAYVSDCNCWYRSDLIVLLTEN